ncbi:HlyD family secretion protein/membrane fusion protein, protease secretion system/membrane fusion protein, epimerase transport system [Ectothiorhodospira magna]|uniref:Membrane fusion protein (MFP) family protein n=1 Tax=Ectothiorhodospira magna TaxID=867345 RepID=A0A1H9BK99_9GAMM|nr:HlyD family type I secretion periplasmic adaptor subunit [Ectothiorhodospira magna]SEP89402.1 HlyD family secretion protein/membrane fusion protein, protease secretion system/membrane fusion protein, epimerase transport system [Ectothiorhodospira magna]
MKDLIKRTGDIISRPGTRLTTEGEGEGGRPSAAVERGPGGIMTLGWLIIILGLFGFGVWAATAPLDSGVTAPGTIVVDSQRIRVQHLTGGIVDDILVRDGDQVHRGQVMIRLNRTNPQAELAIVRSQLLSFLAVEARLLAERDGADALVLPPDVVQEMHDPRIAQVVSTQQQLFTTRRDGLGNELAILEENARGIREQIQGLEAQQTSKRRQIELLEEELAAMQVLFEEGYVPRTRIFELERALAQTQAGLSEDIAALGRARAALSEVRLHKVQREQEYHKDIDTQLGNIQREVDSLQERRIALTDQLERVEIRAPVTGVVVNRQINSIGGVIRAGEDILELVPDGEPLVVQAQVPPQSIELVTEGLTAMVRFTALSTMNPVVEGQVTRVSADRLTDQRSGMDYFEVRIEVTPEELARLTFERIVPGMPVDVVIRTGEHSLLHYLLKPVMDHVFTAFRER